jgi:hypothetical protein
MNQYEEAGLKEGYVDSLEWEKNLGWVEEKECVI